MNQFSNITPEFLTDIIGELRGAKKEIEDELEEAEEAYKRFGVESATGEFYQSSLTTGERRTLNTKLMKETLDPEVLEPFWRTDQWVRLNVKKLFEQK